MGLGWGISIRAFPTLSSCLHDLEEDKATIIMTITMSRRAWMQSRI